MLLTWWFMSLATLANPSDVTTDANDDIVTDSFDLITTG